MIIAISMIGGAALLMAAIQVQILHHGGIDTDAVNKINEKWGK